MCSLNAAEMSEVLTLYFGIFVQPTLNSVLEVSIITKVAFPILYTRGLTGNCYLEIFTWKDVVA